MSLTNRTTHLCKCNGVTDLHKHPSPCVNLPRRTWLFYGSSRVRIKYRRTRTVRVRYGHIALERRASLTGPRRYALPRPIWLFFKECNIEPSKLGSAGTPPLRNGAVNDPCKQLPLHVCYRVIFGSSATKGIYA